MISFVCFLVYNILFQKILMLTYFIYVVITREKINTGLKILK